MKIIYLVYPAVKSEIKITSKSEIKYFVVACISEIESVGSMVFVLNKTTSFYLLTLSVSG